jgi:Flp pilus assembly pilin Flp
MWALRGVRKEATLELSVKVSASTQMGNLLTRIWREEQGQDLVEYALIAALTALAAIVTLQNVAVLVVAAFTNSAANMSSTST